MWEEVNNKYPHVYRLAVPGGWIYRVSSGGDQIVFVPDTAARDAALQFLKARQDDQTNH